MLPDVLFANCFCVIWLVDSLFFSISSLFCEFFVQAWKKRKKNYSCCISWNSIRNKKL